MSLNRLLTAKEASLKTRGEVKEEYNNEYDPIIEEKFSDVIDQINNAIDLKYTSIVMRKYIGGDNLLYFRNKGYQIISKDLTDPGNPIIQIKW